MFTAILLACLFLFQPQAGSNDRGGNGRPGPDKKPPAALIDVLGLDKLVAKVEAAMDRLGKTWETSADRVLDRATVEARSVVQPYEVGAGVAGGVVVTSLIVAAIALGVSIGTLRYAMRRGG